MQSGGIGLDIFKTWCNSISSIADLPDVARVLESDDLCTLHATGWLEDAAIFSEPEIPKQTP